MPTKFSKEHERSCETCYYRKLRDKMASDLSFQSWKTSPYDVQTKIEILIGKGWIR